MRFPPRAERGVAGAGGDPAGIGFYIDSRAPLHVGTEQTAADTAFSAWLADRNAGRDSLLLGPTNAIVDDLNARAHARIAAHVEADPNWRPDETVLLDQLRASVRRRHPHPPQRPLAAPVGH